MAQNNDLRDLDRRIADVLAGHDEELPEPGYFRLAFSVFAGPQGWVSWVIMAVQTALFLASIWCATQFYAAIDVLPALKWGLSGAVLLILATQIKLSLMPVMQANRILLALRRLELHLTHKG